MSSDALRPLASMPHPTYFESLGIPGARSMLTWIGLAVIAIGSAGLGYWRWHAPALIGTISTLGLCIAIVPAAMKAIYSILMAWAQQATAFLRPDSPSQCEWQEWFEEQFNDFNSSRLPCYFATIYAIFAVVTFWLGGAFSGLPVPMAVLCVIFALIASFACGVGLAAMFGLARIIWLLGRGFAVRVSEHSYGVLSTGHMLLKSYVLVAIVWCLYTASASFSLRGKWIPLLSLAIPAVIFFVGSFIVCQFPLRKRMVECKRTALLALDDLLEQLRPKQPSEMTEERQRQMNFCLSEIKRVESWPEWPFSIGNLSGVIGASLGAIAPQIIHMVLPLIVKHPL